MKLNTNISFFYFVILKIIFIICFLAIVQWRAQNTSALIIPHEFLWGAILYTILFLIKNQWFYYAISGGILLIFSIELYSVFQNEKILLFYQTTQLAVPIIQIISIGCVGILYIIFSYFYSRKFIKTKNSQ